MNLGLYPLSGKTSYRKISWSLEAARFGFKLFQSVCNLAGTSAALLPRCLSNFRAIRRLQQPISRLRYFTRFGGKTSYRLVNRGPVYKVRRYKQCSLSRNHGVENGPKTAPAISKQGNVDDNKMKWFCNSWNDNSQCQLFATGAITCYQNDNLLCQQWQNIWYHEGFRFSVHYHSKDIVSTIHNIFLWDIFHQGQTLVKTPCSWYFPLFSKLNRTMSHEISLSGMEDHDDSLMLGKVVKKSKYFWN